MDKNFILLSKTKLFYIKQNELHSVVQLQNTKKIQAMSDITCGLCFSMPASKRPAEKDVQDSDSYAEEQETVLTVYTGHVDGQIVEWINLIPNRTVSYCQTSVVEMAVMRTCLAVATSEGVIEFWTKNFERSIKKVDVRSFAFKLICNNIKNLVVTSSSLYFVTYGGDFVKLKLLAGHEKGKDTSFTYRVRLK